MALIATEEDRDDSNVERKTDEEGDERGCEVVCYNGWQVRNVDMAQLVVLVERLKRHALR